MLAIIPIEEFDNDLMADLLEVFNQFHQEVEIIAISLEKSSEREQMLRALHYHFEALAIKAQQINIGHIAEGLAQASVMMAHVCDIGIIPNKFSDLILLVIDRILLLVEDLNTLHEIDMAKTQQVLVAIQYVVQANNPESLDQSVQEALQLLTKGVEQEEENINDSVFFFDEAVNDDPEDRGTAEEAIDHNEAVTHRHSADIITFKEINNPLNIAKDFIESEIKPTALETIANLVDSGGDTKNQHNHFLLEFGLACNILARSPIDNMAFAEGIIFHDLALAALPELINKKGKFDESDWAKIHEHPQKSLEVAKKFTDKQDAHLAILQHHERLNGSGYPYGLKKGDISESGKLLGIIDSFHGMISQRPHKRFSKNLLRASSEINAYSDRLYDRHWVIVFNTFLREYWLPTKVKT